MNQRFAKDVYRQSGTNDSPMKHSVAEGRSREEGSKLVLKNKEAFFGTTT